VLSGDPQLKSQCLPFKQIPHTSKLFTDYLSYSPQVQPFYPRSPHFTEWFKSEVSRVNYDGARREQVAAILERQNKAWNASPKTLENVARLRKGAAAVVTGQQVGLFGGPVFAIYKALTAVKLADQATAAGVECVPVFWLATHDHDLAEVNHVSIPGPDAALQTFATSAQGVEDAPVGTVQFGAEIEAVVEAAAALLDPESATLLRESYKPGETLGSAYARFFARLFADWGVVLLDPSDPEFHQIAAPLFIAAIERCGELDDALLARGKELENSGYHQQVKVTSSSTLLFAVQNDVRIPVHRRAGATAGVSEFLIGQEKISQEDLLKRIATSPQNFNPNVLLRPVVQDFLLPTIAYIGGAAEVAYFAQIAVVYQALQGRITPILFRFSATMLDHKHQALLERYRLTLPDLFAGSSSLSEQLAARSLSQEVQKSFDQASSGLEKSLEVIRESLGRLDQTLVEAANNAGSKMQHQLEQLRARAARAELRHSEILGRHAEFLSNALYPNKTLQEREIAGIYFVSRHGKEFLQTVYDAINPECLDHQIISL
jgi:bacillithiol biosynthesis cysteine-adding enzyme BshC